MDHTNLFHSLNLLHKVKRQLIFKIIKEETLFNRPKKHSKVKWCPLNIRCFHHASFQMAVDKHPQFKTPNFTIPRQ